jgi:transcriptional regulator with XRE-family HTH domain
VKREPPGAQNFSLEGEDWNPADAEAADSCIDQDYTEIAPYPEHHAPPITPAAGAVLCRRRILRRAAARLRKERGYTQVELAEKIGIIQDRISDYERDKLRPDGDMVARFALALDVSADALLGIVPLAKTRATHNRRFLRRMQAMDKLPKRDQEARLRTIDAFLDRAKTG